MTIPEYSLYGFGHFAMLDSYSLGDGKFYLEYLGMKLISLRIVRGGPTSLQLDLKSHFLYLLGALMGGLRS